MNKGSLSRHFTVSLPPLPLPHQQQQLQSTFSNVPLSNPSRFQNVLESEELSGAQSHLPLNLDADPDDVAEKDFILSQDFFWYIFELCFSIHGVFGMVRFLHVPLVKVFGKYFLHKYERV